MRQPKLYVFNGWVCFVFGVILVVGRLVYFDSQQPVLKSIVNDLLRTGLIVSGVVWLFGFISMCTALPWSWWALLNSFQLAFHAFIPFFFLGFLSRSLLGLIVSFFLFLLFWFLSAGYLGSVVSREIMDPWLWTEPSGAPPDAEFVRSNRGADQLIVALFCTFPMAVFLFAISRSKNVHKTLVGIMTFIAFLWPLVYSEQEGGGTVVSLFLGILLLLGYNRAYNPPKPQLDVQVRSGDKDKTKGPEPEVTTHSETEKPSGEKSSEETDSSAQTTDAAVSIEINVHER